MLSTITSFLILLFFVTTVSAYPFEENSFPRLQDTLATGTKPGDPPKFGGAYDYVVVGGGTTGLLVASRLAKAGKSVAVIENGTYPTGNLTTVPGYNEQWFSRVLPSNWTDFVNVWPTVQQVGGGEQQHMMGRMIGGSQGFTFVDYFRTTKGALERWANETGDNSWTWENVQQYYRKSFKFTPPNNAARPSNATPDYESSQIVGSTPGPLELTFPKYAQAFGSWVKLGLNELKAGINRVFVEGDIKGASWILNMIDSQTGNRATTYTAFLEPTQKDGTSKIDVYVETLAERTLSNTPPDSDPVTIGVLVKRGGIRFPISAAKEVILAGGPILTPQFLMVSGIGPQDHLREMNISVRANRPGVGQNYNDHILFGVKHAVQVETTSVLLNTTRKWQECERFKAHADGMLADPGPNFAAFVDYPEDIRQNLSAQTKSDLSQFPSDWPDIGIVSSPLGVNGDGNHNYADLVCIPMKPISKGTIKLRSKSMDDKPVLDPQWLKSPTDMDAAVAGLQYLLRLYGTNSMKPILDASGKPIDLESSNKDDLIKYVKNNYRTLNHQSASCRMGKRDDPMAVVDSKGKVIGVDRLRIADPSAWPFLPAGFPLGTAYMFAEKIADNILSDHGSDKDEDGDGDEDELRVEL
ncbi:versicolorin B synthase [Aspergillus awamori]|uniref:Versicolorin B synthase n=1 Tax=Aspergillus awamori TaxID=105351 RepID=A0A401L7Z9_ASPAW|nr:versicolorin B synthase [Aspergillus awamori]